MERDRSGRTNPGGNVDRPGMFSTGAVFAQLLTVAIISALVIRSLVQDQEEDLLEARTSDMEAVTSGYFNEQLASAEMVSASLATQTDTAEAFRRSAFPLVGTEAFSTVALLQLDANGVSIRESVGAIPVGDGNAVPDLASSAARALANPSSLTASPIVVREGKRYFALLTHTPDLPANQVLYLENLLRPAGTQQVGSFAPFGEIRVALYLGSNQDPANLVVSNTDQLPLEDDIVTRALVFGNDTYLLATNARAPLTGSLSNALPLVILGLGALSAILASLVVAVVHRRRHYAFHLVDEKTAELQQSLEALNERSQREATLRTISRDVASAPDFASAITALYETVTTYIPIDRAAISLVVGPEEVEVLAAAGPLAHEVSTGQRVHIPAGVLTNENASDVSTWPNYRLGMQSATVIPLIAGGETRAILTLASRATDAYSDDQKVFLDDLGRETAPVFIQLLALEREREAALHASTLDQLKTEFVGIVAHDLRSPMTVIAGFADILRMHGSALSEEQRSDYLQRISTSTNNLARLVEDVLQVARIDSGELDCRSESFDLGAMIAVSAEEVASTYPGRELELDISPDLPPAQGDEQRQWQVFTNLISNAFKYSTSDPVRVTVSVVDTMIRVAVTDHGIGIRNQDVGLLFQKFARVTQPDGHRAPGTGLGLYIARSIVETQHGTISVDTVEGEGSTFTYTVPMVVDAHAAPTSSGINA